MAVLSPISISVIGTITSRTTATLNGTAGDTCVVTINGGAVGTWEITSRVNCAATPLTGNNGGTTTLTLNSAGTYTLDITFVRESTGAVRYGRVTGTISASTSDIDPDPFSFAAKSGVGIAENIDSDPITITGINAPASISATNGSYFTRPDANTAWAGPFAGGTITNNTQIKARVLSSTSFADPRSVVIQITNAQASFTATTVARDAIPDNYSFPTKSGTALDTQIFSDPQTITGINDAVPISITGGAYSINNGEFGFIDGTIRSGWTLALRVRSSPSFSTDTSATVKIGDPGATVDRVFTVRTQDRDAIPNDFSFTNKTNTENAVTTSDAVTISGINVAVPISITGGTYSIGTNAFTASASTISNNSSVRIQVTAPAIGGNTATATLTVGEEPTALARTFSVTTIVDGAPNDFSINPITNAALGDTVNSAAVTISGVNVSVPISITGGKYSIGTNAFTADSGNISNNASVRVQVVAAATPGTPTTANLTVGNTGVSLTKPFTVTTVPVDSTPNAFPFSPQSGVARSTAIESNEVTITGINVAVSASISGGTYRRFTNGAWGAYTNAAITADVKANDRFQVKVDSSPSFSTPTSTTLTVGGVDSTFTVTTLAIDTTPDNPFGFTNVPLAKINTIVPAPQPIAISGVNTTITVSRFSGTGEFSTNGTDWRTTSVDVENGASIYIRQLSASTFNKASTTELDIGSRRASFTVTTESEDKAPDQFSFGTPVPGAELNGTYTSPEVTIQGINSASTLTFSNNGLYRKFTNGSWGSYTTQETTVIAGDKIQIQLQAASTFNTLRQGTVSIGGVSASYSVTTLQQDTTPDQFYFTDVSNAEPNILYTSNQITIGGTNSASNVSFSGSGEYRKFNGTTWSAWGTGTTTAVSGNLFEIRITAAPTTGTPREGTLNVGGISDTYTVATVGSTTDITPDQFSFEAVLLAELNTEYPSNTITVSGINAPTNISISIGQYQIGNNSWTSTPSTVSNGAIVKVKNTSSPLHGILSRATLNIGGVTANFDIITKEQVATSDYGFEVYNTAGVKTLSATSRVPRLVAAGSTTITVQPAAGVYASSPIYISGLVGSDDSWQILIYEDSSIQTGTAFYTAIGTNLFYVIGSNATALPGPNNTVFNIGYYVLRS